MSKTIGNIKDNTIEEIWNSAEMVKLRASMLRGESSDICKYCTELESAGFSSYRKSNADLLHDKRIMESIASTDGQGHSRYELRSLDYRPTNLCNLQCKMCDSSLSSGVARSRLSAKGLPGNGVISIGKTFQELFAGQFGNISSIYFAGGEPLIMSEHWDFLTYLIDIGRAPEINLLINTNCMNIAYMGNTIETVWPKFNRVDVLLSIDGMGEGLEYWRKGSKWGTILDNICRIKATANRATISSAVGWPNLISWCDMVEHFHTTGSWNLLDLWVVPILSPDWARLSRYPSECKQVLLDRVDSVIALLLPVVGQDNRFLIQVTQIRELITSSEPTVTSEELDYINTLDRDSDLLKAFPEHSAAITIIRTNER